MRPLGTAAYLRRIHHYHHDPPHPHRARFLAVPWFLCVQEEVHVHQCFQNFAFLWSETIFKAVRSYMVNIHLKRTIYYNELHVGHGSGTLRYRVQHTIAL